MFWILPVIVIVAIALWFIRTANSEDERIKVFLRVYRKNQKENPDFSERKLLETVAEWHIPHGSTRTWRDDGLTGQQYMDGVFEDRKVVLRELIVHLMGLEYPKSYGWQSENIDEQMAVRRAGKRTKKEIRIQSLETRIDKLATELSVTLKKSGQPAGTDNSGASPRRV